MRPACNLRREPYKNVAGLPVFKCRVRLEEDSVICVHGGCSAEAGGTGANEAGGGTGAKDGWHYSVYGNLAGNVVCTKIVYVF
jgi:hypothetical protein